MATVTQTNRPHSIFGTVALSCQDTDFHSATRGTSYEVALISDGAFVKPSVVGLDGFDHHWGDRDVATWMLNTEVLKLRRALASKFGRPHR